MTEQRCAVVAVLGAPNAGKSTLVNTLVGAKVAAVTQKVQTTRALIRGRGVCAQQRCATDRCAGTPQQIPSIHRRSPHDSREVRKSCERATE